MPEYRFPTKHEERFNNIAPSINDEPKNITLAFCLSRTLKSRNDLSKGFSDLVCQKYLLNDKTIGDYAHFTFHPMGLCH